MKRYLQLGLYTAALLALPGYARSQTTLSPDLIHFVSYTPRLGPAPEDENYFKYRPKKPAPDASADATPRAFEVPSMPAYTVNERRLESFRNRDLYTRAGMEDAEFRRYPGLYAGDLFHLNRKAAYEMYLQDDWRATMGDYHDLAQAMAAGGDRTEGRMIITAMEQEDLRVRSEGEETQETVVTPDLFQVARIESDSPSIRLPEIPIDVPVVRVKW
ncbi:MAG TPA: hypothetical protein VGG37_08695 [Opitutaceae bacterium]|jgi:hypothetical protein